MHAANLFLALSPFQLFSTMDDDDLRDMHYGGESLDRFATYEDYLDSQISETDMYYLEVKRRIYDPF